MIKNNVLRKNLLTNEIDYGVIDSEFENSNLNGFIINEFPFIELDTGSQEAIDFITTIELKRAKELRQSLLMQEYNKIKGHEYFAFEYNNVVYKPQLNENIDWWSVKIQENIESIDRKQNGEVSQLIVSLDTRYVYEGNEWKARFPINGIVINLTKNQLQNAKEYITMYRDVALWDSQLIVMQTAIANATTKEELELIVIAYKNATGVAITQENPYIFNLNLL
jgi:hypothetical protein